jgi:hypothetical protein
VSGGGRAHTTVVKTALTAQGLTVYVGGAPDDPVFPYVAVYSDAGRGLRTAMEGSTDHYVYTFQTSCVGVTHEQATWVAEKVQTALSGKTLTVSGWATGPVEHIMSGIGGRDYDAPTDINTKYDQWRYHAVPTS